MNTSPHQLPDISSYIQIIDQFIEHTTSAAEFESTFLRAVKDERRIIGDPVFPILQELFEDADAYVQRPELRTEPEDLNDEQLLACAHRARDALKELGFD